MNERADITIAVCERLQLARIVRMAWHVIGADRKSELTIAQNAHDRKEIDVPLIRINFREVVQAAANVPHVHLVNFAALGQITHNWNDFVPRVLEPFGSRAKTQLKAVVWAVHD